MATATTTRARRAPATTDSKRIGKPMAIRGTDAPEEVLETRRAEALARLTTNIGKAKNIGFDIHDDLLIIADGVSQDRWAEEVTARVASLRPGRVMPAKDRIRLAKKWADEDRPGGRITGKAIAEALGVSQGLISGDLNTDEDGESLAPATGGGKTDLQKLEKVRADLIAIMAKLPTTPPKPITDALKQIEIEARKLSA